MPSPPPAENSDLPDLPEPVDTAPVQRESRNQDAEPSQDAVLDDSEREVLESDDGMALRFGPEFPVAETVRQPVEPIRQRPKLLPPKRFMVAASGFEAVTEQTFARIGVVENETRVVAIRNASRRAATQILAAHRAGAVTNVIDPLADLAWTTYRLVDPRYRLLPFQQIRVGRILPLALHQAAILDLVRSVPENGGDQPNKSSGTEISPAGLAADAKPGRLQSTPVLFGQRLPVVSYPTAVDSTTSKLNLAATAHAATLLDSSNRLSQAPPIDKVLIQLHSESHQAYTELRQSSRPNYYQNAIRDKRVSIGLIVVASAAATVLLAFAVRRAITPSKVIAQTTKHQSKTVDPSIPIVAKAAVVEPLTPELSTPEFSTTESPPPESPPPRDETAIGSERNIDSSAGQLDASAGASVEDVFTPAPLPEPVILAKPNEEPAATSIAATSAPSEMEGTPSDWTMPELASKSIPGEALTADPSVTEKVSPDLSVPVVNPTETSSNNSTEDSPLVSSPGPSRLAIPWDLNDAEAVAAEIWGRTPSAARRFTSATAAELIDQWDFDAELAGYGTVEHAAARSLSLRAAWLVEPFAQLVQRIREQGPIRHIAKESASDSLDVTTYGPTSHLGFDELTSLSRSWKDARGRVVIADDLDQLLHQANVLVDRILVSDQISPQERSDLIAEMTLNTERLLRIARDENTIAESSQLAEALESFPGASELERLEAAEGPSGFLGRIRCLKQRQWDTGLPWLAKTSDRAIASCAQAECKLLDSGSVTPGQWMELAQRWAKVAERLPEREAAAVRLHAIELHGDSSEYASQREELTGLLPRYMVR